MSSDNLWRSTSEVNHIPNALHTLIHIRKANKNISGLTLLKRFSQRSFFLIFIRKKINISDREKCYRTMFFEHV